ncbi:glutathione-dependent formaldehyde-activating protein [Cladophialophora carrionii]|uniref:Glutathione-dependent formaldehyde-activating protein n=1 Tax=Cladophialophora carrionii TaxID=86049 RepID=A0A1C1CYL8_9EURO|nr:glutathione-dependent formaldehyde-activating protein [Cladophialophora carrionii]
MAPQGVVFPIEGGCRWCQRETGASFALHAMIETERLKLLKGEPEWTTVPSASGAGQRIGRCATCKTAVWSVYNAGEIKARVKDSIRIVDVGTLDNPDAWPPDAHVWISDKQPWIILSNKTPAFQDSNYVREEVWSKESLERRRKAGAFSDDE